MEIEFSKSKKIEVPVNPEWPIESSGAKSGAIFRDLPLTKPTVLSSLSPSVKVVLISLKEKGVNSVLSKNLPSFNISKENVSRSFKFEKSPACPEAPPNALAFSSWTTPLI
jgi:hypothetical protein